MILLTVPLTDNYYNKPLVQMITPRLSLTTIEPLTQMINIPRLSLTTVKLPLQSSDLELFLPLSLGMQSRLTKILRRGKFRGNFFFKKISRNFPPHRETVPAEAVLAEAVLAEAVLAEAVLLPALRL
jgi:hypothetical protein